MTRGQDGPFSEVVTQNGRRIAEAAGGEYWEVSSKSSSVHAGVRSASSTVDFNVDAFFSRVAGCCFDTAVQSEVDREVEGNVDISKPPGTLSINASLFLIICSGSQEEAAATTTLVCMLSTYVHEWNTQACRMCVVLVEGTLYIGAGLLERVEIHQQLCRGPGRDRWRRGVGLRVGGRARHSHACWALWYLGRGALRSHGDAVLPHLRPVNCV